MFAKYTVKPLILAAINFCISVNKARKS